MTTDLSNDRVSDEVRIRLSLLVPHYLHYHCGIKMSGMASSARRARTKIGLEHQLVCMAQDLLEKIDSHLEITVAEADTFTRTLASAIRDVQFRGDNFLVQTIEELSEATQQSPEDSGGRGASGPTSDEEDGGRPGAGAGDDGPTQRVMDYASHLEAMSHMIGASHRYGPVAPDEADLTAWDRPRPITALGRPGLRRLSSGRLVRVTAVPLAALMTPASHDAQLLVAALLQSLPVALVSEVDRRSAGDSEFRTLSCANLDADRPVSALAWLFRACELGATDLLVVDTCGEDEIGRIHLLCGFGDPESGVVVR